MFLYFRCFCVLELALLTSCQDVLAMGQGLWGKVYVLESLFLLEMLGKNDLVKLIFVSRQNRVFC